MYKELDMGVHFSEFKLQCADIYETPPGFVSVSQNLVQNSVVRGKAFHGF